MEAGCLRALIVLASTSRNSQPFNLAAGYLFKFGLPALLGPGDEKEDQTVPGFTQFVFGCTNLHKGDWTISAIKSLGAVRFLAQLQLS